MKNAGCKNGSSKEEIIEYQKTSMVIESIWCRIWKWFRNMLYIYRPQNKEDLMLWIEYLSPSYDPIRGVHPKPDFSIPYQPYGSGKEFNVYDDPETLNIPIH